MLFWQANRIIGPETRLRESQCNNPRIEGAWQAQNTEKESPSEPLPEIATTPPETPHANSSSSLLLVYDYMLHCSLRPAIATRAVHTSKAAGKSLSSLMSSATLDLGAESQLSDKKAVRKQLHSLLSSLPPDHVQRQCPSSVVTPCHP